MNLPDPGKTLPSSNEPEKHPPTIMSLETCRQLESNVSRTKTRLTWKIREKKTPGKTIRKTLNATPEYQQKPLAKEKQESGVNAMGTGGIQL